MKSNNRRKIGKILSLVITACYVFMVCTPVVYAAGSFSVSGGGTVSAGGTKTITIKASSCAGKFTISASNGGKVSSSSLFLDSGSGTVTVTAPSSGSTKVTVTASDVTDYDGKAVTGSKSVTVSVAVADTRSTNSNLSSLTVDKGTLSPEFASGTTSYTVNVVDESEITISANASDSKASVSGTGKKTLESGENSFSVVVTAENGSKKTYTIKVKLEETPKVYSDFNGSNYGFIVDTTSASVPGGFEASTISFNGQEVTSWYNANCDVELVYLIDEDGEKGLYVIEEDVIVSTFRVVAVLGQNLYALDVPVEEQERSGMAFEEVEIDGIHLTGWSFNDEELADYSIVQLMKSNGELADFLYFAPMTSMIEYPSDKFIDQEALDLANEQVSTISAQKSDIEDELGTMTTVAVAVGAVAAMTTISTGIGFTMSRNYKKDYFRIKELFSQGNSMDNIDLDL